MVIFRKKNCFALALMGLIAASTSAFAAKETPIQTLQNQINDLKVESSNIDESISENSKALDQAKKCLKNPDDPMCEDANPGDCACWPSSAQGGPCGVDVWDTHECEVLNHDAFRRVKSNAETSGRMLVFSMESGDLSAQAGQVYQECFNKAYPTSAQTKITGYYRQSLNAAQKRAACEVLKGAGNLSGECKQTVNSCLGNKVKQQVQQLTGNIQESKKQKQKVDNDVRELQVQLQTTIKACPECAKGGSGTLDAIVGITQAVAPVVMTGINANAQMKMMNKSADMYSAYLNNNYLAYQENVQQCITLGIPCNAYQVSAPTGGVGGIGYGVGIGYGGGLSGSFGAGMYSGSIANGIATAIASAVSGSFSGMYGGGSFGYSPAISMAMGYPSMGIGAYGMSGAISGAYGAGSFGYSPTFSGSISNGIAVAIGNAFTGSGVYGGGYGIPSTYGAGFSGGIAGTYAGGIGLYGGGIGTYGAGIGTYGAGIGTYGAGIGAYGGGIGLYGGGFGYDPSMILNQQMQSQNQQNLMISQQQMMEVQNRYQQMMGNMYYSNQYGGGIGAYGGVIGGYGYPSYGSGSIVNAIGTAIGTGFSGGSVYPYSTTTTGGGSTF